LDLNGLKFFRIHSISPLAFAGAFGLGTGGAGGSFCVNSDLWRKIWTVSRYVAITMVCDRKIPASFALGVNSAEDLAGRGSRFAFDSGLKCSR
jgi:hypothetical protein